MSDQPIAPTHPVLTPEKAADLGEQILEHLIAAKGGTRRPGQVQMARDVGARLVEERPLMIQGGTGIGKALDIKTPIPTPRGFVRMGEIQVGDEVLDEHGNPVTVTHAFDVMYDRPCFEVEFSDGSTIVADADHLWTTVPVPTLDSPPPTKWAAAREPITTSGLADTLTDASDRNQHAIPVAGIPAGVEAEVPISPYVLGMWLGGTSENAMSARVLAVHAPKSLEGFNREEHGRFVKFHPTEETALNLKALGVTDGGKHIPEAYLFAAVEQRKALLAGLLDASGFVVQPPRSTGQVQFTEAVERLAADTRTLICSLGFQPTFSARLSKDKSKVRTWLVRFTPDREVFASAEKNARLRLGSRTSTLRRADFRAVVAVTPVTSRPVRCISVDSETHLYLAGHTFIPTHNSIALIAGALASGKQAVVAPHTKALQDQLAKDLALVEETFAEDFDLIGHPPTHAVIKGRSSYACLAKVNGGMELGGDDPGEYAAPTSALGQEVTRLREWAAVTDSGDRSSLPFTVTSRAWEQVSVTAEACTSKACAFYEECFAEQARTKAKAADIIVTNQSFLAMAMRIDGQAGRPILLPESVGAIIVDEAHEFASVVANTFGALVTMGRLRATVKRTAALDKIDEGKATALREKAVEAIDRLEHLVPLPRTADRALIAQDAVRDGLEAVSDRFGALRTFAEALPTNDDQEKAGKELLARTLDNLVFDLDLLRMGDSDNQVAWVEPQGDKVVLRSAQFDVSERIFKRLIEPHRSVVFTSATLTVGGRFDQPARENGFTLGPWAYNVVPSPFDYEKNALLWTPADMPLPGTNQIAAERYSAAVADTAAKVVRAAGGRTLVLCTSRASVQQVATRLRATLEPRFPVLVQEPGEPTKRIAEEFTANPRAVLVGTRAFWAGISIEGDTCAAVVLDKTPFPSPGDPIIAARTEKAERSRRSGFAEVSLPEALLTVVQGAGRLIRTIDDRGVVVLCDPRTHVGGPLAKGYAREVMRSLPPFKRATSEAEVMEFLANIDRTANDVSHVEVDEAA